MKGKRPGDTFSYLVKDLNWRQAVRAAKKKAKDQNIEGLEYICAVPKCFHMERLMLFKHPQNGYEMYLCLPHWRLVEYEMKELQRKYDTQINFFAKSGNLAHLAAKNGGKLPSIEIYD